MNTDKKMGGERLQRTAEFRVMSHRCTQIHTYKKIKYKNTQHYNCSN
jgi:hypothetical protein